jgi:hypothetical protein
MINLGEFNAVCIVIKGTTTRANAIIKYVVGEIRSFLPKEAINNFIVCATFNQKKTVSKGFMKVLEKIGLEKSPIITFDNSAYEVQEEEDEEDKKAEEKNFNNTWEKLENLIETAAKFPAYKSEGIRIIKEKRSKI